jgi:hypothetical protein
MIAQCNFIPKSVWIREVKNGIRHITLRRNFAEETVFGECGERDIYTFETTDVYIPDRDNIEQFITENFGNLFDLGLQQTEEKNTKDKKVQKAKEVIESGQIIEDMQTLGQQITNIMLEV